MKEFDLIIRNSK